jgi:hypothetical protein
VRHRVTFFESILCYDRSRMRILCIATLFLSPGQPLLHAQTREAATLTGVVTHPTGAPISDASAEIHPSSTPTRTLQTVTDSTGTWHFSALPSDEYDLRFSRPGFSPLTLRSISISPGEQKELPPIRLSTTYCGDDRAALDYARLIRPGSYTGSLVGRVILDQRPLLDQSPPVPSADVTLVCSTGKPCGATTTNEDGEFAFWDLPPGTFAIRVDRPGYYSIDKPGYLIQEDLESVYRPIYLERCSSGSCDPAKRPKRVLSLCE